MLKPSAPATTERATRRAVRSTSALVLASVVAIGGLLVVSPATQAHAVECSAEQGQVLIDNGRYERAVREFTCLVDAEPTEIEGYRGRSEANLRLGRYSDAYRDYALITSFVMPAHPDAADTILAAYAARLAVAPDDVSALTGASFARWVFFDYAQAIHLLNRLVDLRPDDVFGNVFRGSSRLLLGATKDRGVADLEQAIRLAPLSPDVRFIVADAYTYGLPDPDRAFAEAARALDWGLDIARVHAILASAYDAFGDTSSAATHLRRHIELVTTELITTSALAVNDSLALDLVPGRTYEIPVAAIAGVTIGVSTSSRDFYDSIAVLSAPDGTPVVGSDDDDAAFAAFDWTAEVTGTYRLLVTSFESVDTGGLIVARD